MTVSNQQLDSIPRDLQPAIYVSGNGPNELFAYIGGHSALGSLPHYFCDAAAFEAIGSPELSNLTVFNERIFANYKNVSHIIHKAVDATAIVAIGSGSMNDCCKLAAYKLRLNYAVVATAASMNGYASANASITSNSGQKESVKANAPVAIYWDSQTLQNAPARLTYSGLADAMALGTVQFDAKLAESFNNNDHTARWLQIQRPYFDALLAQPEESKQSTEALISLLLAGGIAMTQSGSSAPASQSEHMLAHLLTAIDPELEEAAHHGELIGYTQQVIHKLHEQFLRQEKPAHHAATNSDWDYLARYYGPEDIADFRNIYAHKSNLIAANYHKFVKNFRTINKDLKALHEDSGQALNLVKTASQKVSLPKMPKITNQMLRAAALTRDRITVLDFI